MAAKKIFLASFLAALTLFLAGQARPASAQVATTCDPIVIESVFRNPSGDYLTNISVELWSQGEDADRRPAPIKKLTSAKTDTVTGKAIMVYKPDPKTATDLYALKVYDKNSEVGSLWYFSEISSLACGQKVDITKVLSGIRFVFRDQDGNLKKNVKFAVYTQRYDIENKPINEKKDLVHDGFDTGSEGVAFAYLADSSHTLKGVGGDYVMVANLGPSIGYVENYLHVNDQQLTENEYVFTDIVLVIEDAAGRLIPAGSGLELYEQKQDVKGKLILGKSLKKVSVDAKGEVLLEYPAGTYAVVVKSDIGGQIVFWNITLEKYKRERKKLVANVTRIEFKDKAGKVLRDSQRVKVYSLTTNDKGEYFRDQLLGSIELKEKGYGEAIMAPGKYLFSLALSEAGKQQEYGRVLLVENGRLQKFTIEAKPENLIQYGKKLPTAAAGPVTSLAQKLKGYILLQTESRGEAWYVDVPSSRRHYLADGKAAYQIMRQLGLGITNNDLAKIPVGLRSDIGGFDTDGDGLSNQLEEALGTDQMNSDTDGDGYQDNSELASGYNPLGSGRLSYDTKLANRLSGRILLQIESKGEAWYLNPKDGKRYYLASGEAAYQVMRLLSLGISNANLEQIGEAAK